MSHTHLLHENFHEATIYRLMDSLAVFLCTEKKHLEEEHIKAMESSSDSEKPCKVFGSLLEITRDFPFSPVAREPEGVSAEELHKFRLLDLIRYAEAIGRWEFRRMPADFQILHSEEDGSAQAILILLEETVDYEPTGERSYNDDMRRRVKWRLREIKRDFYRKNPPVDNVFSKCATSLKRKCGRLPSARELAEATGRSMQAAQDFLDFGPGLRTFGPMPHNADGAADDWAEKIEDDGPSPAELIEDLEFKEIFLDCFDQLDSKAKDFIIQHYIEGKKYNDIAKKHSTTDEAVRKRCRRGASALFECIEKQYGEVPDFSEISILPEIATRGKKE